MIVLWLAAGVLGQSEAVVPPVEEVRYTGGTGVFRRPHSYHLEDETERDELRKEIVKIGAATPQEVNTGLVQTPRRQRKPNIETLARVNADRLMAEQTRQEQIRRQIAADDDWLMMA